jgi:hypothetical protein
MSCYQLVHLDGSDEARIIVAKRFGVLQYICVYELVTCGIANSSFEF